MKKSQIIKAMMESKFNEKQMSAMSYDSGPYEITEIRGELYTFVRLIEAAERERCAVEAARVAGLPNRVSSAIRALGYS